MVLACQVFRQTGAGQQKTVKFEHQRLPLTVSYMSIQHDRLNENTIEVLKKSGHGLVVRLVKVMKSAVVRPHQEAELRDSVANHNL